VAHDCHLLHSILKVTENKDLPKLIHPMVKISTAAGTILYFLRALIVAAVEDPNGEFVGPTLISLSRSVFVDDQNSTMIRSDGGNIVSIEHCGHKVDD